MEILWKITSSNGMFISRFIKTCILALLFSTTLQKEIVGLHNYFCRILFLYGPVTQIIIFVLKQFARAGEFSSAIIQAPNGNDILKTALKPTYSWFYIYLYFARTLRAQRR